MSRSGVMLHGSSIAGISRLIKRTPRGDMLGEPRRPPGPTEMTFPAHSRPQVIDERARLKQAPNGLTRKTFARSEFFSV